MSVIDEVLARANRNWTLEGDAGNEAPDALALANEVMQLRGRLAFIRLVIDGIIPPENKEADGGR